MNAVAADYLDTLGIPLRQGRMLNEYEINTADRVALINEAAGRLWPSGDPPIGRRIRLNELEKPGRPDILTPANASPYVTIVGVVGNTRNDDLRTDTQPVVLIPYTLLAPPGRTLAIRAQSNPKMLVSALRAQVREMDSEQPLSTPLTLDEILGFRTAQPRFTMVLFSLFAALGLMLTLAGIYSVLSYLVSMRTREIGVRMALGARPADILQLIMRAGGRLVGVGIIIGIFFSVVTVRLLGSQLNLFQVTNTDPVSFLGVVLLLTVVAAFACFIPARRATKVDPMVALRYD
jgi:putative ABC transport system permease protein